MSEYVITNGNHKGRRIDIYFDGIPGETLRTKMKADKWQFFPPKKCWYNFFSAENEHLAERYCKQFDNEMGLAIAMKNGCNKEAFQYAGYELYDDPEIDEWEDESVLRQLGYSVSKANGLSETERHDIIQMAIKKRFITKGEVINFLKGMINTRSPRYCMVEAVSKWQTDLEFTKSL